MQLNRRALTAFRVAAARDRGASRNTSSLGCSSRFSNRILDYKFTSLARLIGIRGRGLGLHVTVCRGWHAMGWALWEALEARRHGRRGQRERPPTPARRRPSRDAAPARGGAQEWRWREHGSGPPVSRHWDGRVWEDGLSRGGSGGITRGLVGPRHCRRRGGEHGSGSGAMRCGSCPSNPVLQSILLRGTRRVV